jgi:stalled ribosome rescue protein Dom34
VTIDDVTDAAESGRVDTLLIEEGRIIAKRLRNKTTGTFEMMDLTQPKLDDLLDDIGELVNKMGGTVLIIPQDKMPSTSGLAAILRY